MLERVFENLGRWRHLPSYQLERRADVFFSVYLREVLEAELGVGLEEVVIPELPIKRDLVWPDHPSNKSVKVDYALFSRDRGVVYFVELKTDAGSRREVQDEYLERARVLGFGAVLEGLLQIVLATTAHGKYHHLTRLLADLGYLTIPADLEEYLYPTPRPGLADRLRGIEVCGPPSRIEVIYLQPEASEGDRCIDFETFAGYVLSPRRRSESVVRRELDGVEGEAGVLSDEPPPGPPRLEGEVA